MNRVSDGDRSTLLSFVSCGASQGYAPQSGEIIGILTVLVDTDTARRQQRVEDATRV